MARTERNARIAVIDGGFDDNGNPLVRVQIGAGIDIGIAPANAEKLGMDLVTEAHRAQGRRRQ